jgi:hypothetical protein
MVYNSIKNILLYGVGFEPTHLSIVDLESTPLNRSGIHTQYTILL